MLEIFKLILLNLQLNTKYLIITVEILYNLHLNTVISIRIPT